MGLDMYLEASRTIISVDPIDERMVAPKYRKELEKRKRIHTELLRLFPELTPNNNKLPVDFITIYFNIGSWRKANAIHNWFVQNVQNGEDDCNKYYVPREKLKELREKCVEALKFEEVCTCPEDDEDCDEEEIECPDEAEMQLDETLPTKSGFFFGGTSYDEYYFYNLKRTIEIIDQALSLPQDKYSLYYQSSW